MTPIDLLLLLIALPSTFGIAIVAVEAWTGLLLPRRRPKQDHELGPIAVLIPAHNEESGILQTLNSITPQLREHDRLLVVADNCTDSTANIVRDAGHQAVTRHDPDHRGKGYALAFGIEQLADNPPQTLIIADADCILAPGALQALAQQVLATGNPAQAIYLLNPPPTCSLKNRISLLAFLVKNLVRPRGLARFNLPCPLTGTGMAFPWPLIATAQLASGNIVEDMALGIELILKGRGARLCENALITSPAPTESAAAGTQRTRWEHGHLQTLLTFAPRLIINGITRLRPSSLFAGLDLAVPPLAMLCMLWLATTILLTLITALTATGLVATITSLLAGLLLLLTILAAVLHDGGHRVSLFHLLAVPGYILWKIPLYFRFLVARQTSWVRTERDS